MKKAEMEIEDELRPEYDFTKMRIHRLGPARTRFGDYVRLEPDVAQAFPTAESVNKALRSLIPAEEEPATRK
jgi:hypothetical protein